MPLVDRRDVLAALAACALASVLAAVLVAEPRALLLGVLAVALAGIVTVLLWAVLQDVSRLPLMLVLAGLGLVAANGLRRGSLTYSDALLIVAAALVVGAAARRGSLRLPWWLLAGTLCLATSAVLVEMFPPLVKTGAIFKVRNLSTGVVGIDPSWVLAARLIGAVAVVPAVVALACTTPSRTRWMVNAWLAGVALTCGVAVLAAFTPIDLQATLTGEDYFFDYGEQFAVRYTGLSVHPTLLGLAAALALPSALARMAPGVVWRYAPLAGLYVLAILVSGSRIALVAAAIGALLVFAWQARARRGLVTAAAIGAALVLAQGTAVQGLASVQRLVAGDATARNSDDDRLTRYAEGWDAFTDRPLTGWGFEAIRGAHNIPLELLSSGGLLALAGWCLIVYGAAWAGWRARRRLPAALAADTVGLVAAVGVLTVAGLTGNAILDRFLYVPVGLLLGLSLLRSGPAPAGTERR